MPLSLGEQRTAQIDKLGGGRRSRRRAAAAADPWRPDRCGCDLPAVDLHVLAHDLDESALQRPVHVLIGPSRPPRARSPPPQPPAPVLQSARGRLIQQVRPSSSSVMRGALPDVVGRRKGGPFSGRLNWATRAQPRNAFSLTDCPARCVAPAMDAVVARVCHAAGQAQSSMNPCASDWSNVSPES